MITAPTAKAAITESTGVSTRATTLPPRPSTTSLAATHRQTDETPVVRRIEGVGEPPVEGDDDPIGHLEQLVELGGDPQHGAAAVGELEQRPAQLHGRSRVEAPRRLAGDRRRPGSPCSSRAATSFWALPPESESASSSGAPLIDHVAMRARRT